MDNRIKEFADNCWKDFFQHVRDSAVYIDSAAAECLHWYTGDKTIARLKLAGAIAVRELCSQNTRNVAIEGARKAVLVYTSAEAEFYRETLKTIVESNRFQSCTVICAAHSSVLGYRSSFETRFGNGDSYDELKHDLERYMSQRLKNDVEQVPIVEIMFRPIFTALINENLFVTPPFWALMPQIGGGNYINEFEANVEHFVSSLHSMFTNFNLREDIYYIGSLSECVAEKLEKLPAAVDRRKRLVGKATGISLVLVDRTLDLCVATSHNTESLLAKIFNTLPRLPEHRNDVAVSMTALCPDGDGVENYSTYCAPGCLASDDSTMINLLIRNKQKDVLVSLHKLLSDIFVAKESPKMRITTRITVHSLEKVVKKYANVEDLKDILQSSKKLQQIIAVIQALKSNKTAQLELMISLEKLILQNVAVSRDSSSILAQLSNIIKTRATRGLTIENLLGLLIHVYALAGTEIHLPEQQERQLEDALTEAIYNDAKDRDESVDDFDMTETNNNLTKLFDGGPISEETTTRISREIMKKLRRISAMRGSLQKYKSLMLKPNPQEIAECVGVLQQLLTDLFDPDKPEIPDLKCKTFSRVSAGLNLFMKGRTRQHPADNDLIIIYVMGGVVVEEVKIFQDIISHRKPHSQAILAGSRLLSPFDVTDHLLFEGTKNS